MGMTTKEKVTEKEKSVKELLEKLKKHLNQQSIEFNKNPNTWSYITSLSFTETKLKEIIEYFESEPK